MAVAEQHWTTYKNPRFGYSLYYPSALFQTQGLPENAGGQTFVTPDKRAKIVVYGALNTDGFSPQEYRQSILKEFPGYERLAYSPIGGTWFVLSGFRGENIYYQKVMFSCQNRVINVFSMTFLTADKPFYEGLIEIMEDHFKPGRGQDTPQTC